MKGRIIEYVEDKDYGFIADEEGNRCFFQASEAETVQPIEVGQFVHFAPYMGEDRLRARNIGIIAEKNNCFIEVCSIRIKLSHIKSYDVTTEETHKKWFRI